jgi:hypothetical protein
MVQITFSDRRTATVSRRVLLKAQPFVPGIMN